MRNIFRTLAIGALVAVSVRAHATDSLTISPLETQVFGQSQWIRGMV